MTNTTTNPGWSLIKPGETVTLAFDFVKLTSAPLTPAVTVTWRAGTADASPSSIKSGSPQISGTKILQQIKPTVDGADYLLSCGVDTADGSHYILDGVLQVRA